MFGVWGEVWEVCWGRGVGVGRVGKYGEVWKMWSRSVKVCLGRGKVCLGVRKVWEMCWGRGNVREVGVQGNVERSVGKCVTVWGRCVRVEEGGRKCEER